MRTIKFRGKKPYTGDWFFGDVLHIAGGSLIYFGSNTDTTKPDIEECNPVAVELFNDECTVVLSDTIGQFTGLLDKNGKEIYEGDIIRSPLGHVVIAKYGYKEHIVKHDIFTDRFAAYGWIVENVRNGITDFLDNEFLQGEVIGNIHDDPELLKGGSDGEI